MEGGTRKGLEGLRYNNIMEESCELQGYVRIGVVFPRQLGDCMMDSGWDVGSSVCINKSNVSDMDYFFEKKVI